MASIHQLIFDGRISQLKICLNKTNFHVNEKDSYDRTPLHLAVLSDQENYGCRVAHLLLEHNADINAMDVQQQTPLIYACILNRSKILSLFLQIKSINWYQIDYQGYSVLHHAASSSQTTILKEILSQINSIGISVDTKTKLGYTPLILAIKSFKFDNAIYLLDHTNASPLAMDDEYHFNCQQWLQNIGLKFKESNLKNSTLLDSHSQSLESSTYTPAILSSTTKDRKTISLITNKSSSYDMYIELVQRFNNHHLIQQIKSSNNPKKTSPWYQQKLNTNQQVITLINDYSSLITVDDNEESTLRYNNRPKSILYAKKSTKKNPLKKAVTFSC